MSAAADTSPMEVVGRGRVYRVSDRLAIGSICTIYRCHFPADGGDVEGTFKVARDTSTNPHVGNEADVLRKLHAANDAERYAPFLPVVEDTLDVGGGDDGSPPARRANVLRMHKGIHSADELYSLEEVRVAHPAGLEARDMAWIWRRLLAVLGFAHAHDVVHTALLPMHVLIEPREHKLLLVDWCAAIQDARRSPRLPALLSAGHLP